MRTYTIKLIEAIEKSKQEIASQWCHSLKENPRTKSFLVYSDSELMNIACDIYGSFRELFFSYHPKEAAQKIFGRYAEERYKKGIPAQEAMYAIVLMRRQIWFFAEFKTIFVSNLEHYQKEESLNRTILLFDYAFYNIIDTYERLRKSGKSFG